MNSGGPRRCRPIGIHNSAAVTPSISRRKPELATTFAGFLDDCYGAYVSETLAR